jgi:hypothetical protein
MPAVGLSRLFRSEDYYDEQCEKDLLVEEFIGQKLRIQSQKGSNCPKFVSTTWVWISACLLFLLGGQTLYYIRIQRSGTYEAGFETEFGTL